MEPLRYDGARDLSSLGGLPGPLVTQSDLWAELGRAGRGVDAAVGAHAYLYPKLGGLDQFNTVELYASASVERYINPTITVSYDVARICGAYVEGGVSHALTSDERGALTLAFLGGYSGGQAQGPRSSDLAYFDHEGVTHVDASTSASFTVGRFAIEPEVHLVLAHDAFATVTGPPPRVVRSSGSGPRCAGPASAPRNK